MPVVIPETLPAKTILEKENIFVMGENRAQHQDIRPLKLAILNLMPTKIATETQLLRLLGNTALQIEITLLHMSSHDSKNTPADHLLNHYSGFNEIRDEKFDGLIITGAPVEHLPFEQVDYWRDLQEIMDWSETHAYSIFHICWGAQAGLYHRYGVPKYPLPAKMFGVRPLVRADSPIFASRQRLRRRNRSTPLAIGLSIGAVLLVGALLGQFFAGSPREPPRAPRSRASTLVA